MKIQVSTDYAVRILQYLHIHQDALPTGSAISQAIGVTYPFFIKIAHLLKRDGLLSAVQGRNGGYQLAKPIHEISFYDVFLSIEGDMRLNRCLQENPHCSQDASSTCRLRGFIGSMQKGLITEMSRKSLLDLGYQTSVAV